MEKPTTNPLKSALGRKIFLATALLVILTVAVAVGVTLLIGNQIAEGAVTKALERANLLQESFDEQRLARLSLIAQIFAADPYFTSYIIEAIDNSDPLSVLDQLQEKRGDLQFDFAMVLDADGKTIARTDTVRPAGDEDLSAEPLVAEALENYQASGVWNKDGALYDVIVEPLGAGEVLHAFLIVGYAIDDQVALRLRRISDTEVTIVGRGEEIELAATTLDEQLARDLLLRLAEDPSQLDAQAGMRRQIELGSRRWLTLTRPLIGAGDEPVGAVVSLGSLQEPMAPYERIYKVLATVGLAAILASLALTWFIVRRQIAPLSHLAEVASQAAEGDYDQRAETGLTDEIGRLANAFDILLSELREKRDMEKYINELSRNLPQSETAMATSTELSPAKHRQLTLLGLELRGYTVEDPEGLSDPAAAALDRLSRDLRAFSNAVGSHGGRIELLAGHRLIATFEGDNRAEHGLVTAAEILVYLSRQGSESTHQGVLVLLDGFAFSGSLAWVEEPQKGLVGEAVEELESLLRVAQPDHLLLSSSAYRELSSKLSEVGLAPKPLRSSISSLPLYSIPARMTALFAAPETSATQVMDSTASVGHTTFSGVGPGSLLGNRFEILSVLGSGGMGIVYKARDITLGELVALKMLKDFFSDEGKQLERLKDELRLARKIGHPNVLRTYDFGELDGVPFISMEYVLGITLRQLFDQSGRLPLSAGLRLARQLCKGLAAAHAESVLHRDIKPENLIIEHTGNVKLMDFGIAQPLTRTDPSKTSPEALVGTPFYLAPEQLAGEEPDERADLYACGVVLYEIFTGKLPFKVTGNIMEIVSRRLQNEPPIPPRDLWPGIPEALERILLRCLEFHREERFESAVALLHHLEELRA